MDRMIAYCGLVCSECGAYIATKANDPAAIERTAAEWRQKHSPDITAADVWCDGCLSSGPRLCSHCGECRIRACAIGRGVVNCACCDDYGCEMITGFLDHVPQAKSVLEEIHAGL
jgi:hypothetical protein